MQYRGILSKWNDDRGFGFIKHSETEMIFLHISEVKQMSRRPREGDFLFYDLVTDLSGKKKAAHAKIEGVPKIIPATSRPARKITSSKSNFSYIMPIIILVLLFFYFINNNFGFSTKDHSNTLYSEIPQEIESKIVKSTFTCQGKTYCSEMTSCEEAKFYLKHCPNQNTDGNGDGEPCESQWCN